jgi:hypothetical protein
MAKPIHIQIPKPCHENWNDMAPNEQGAYCKSCCKTVIDFTRKTENEIYEILANSDGNTCGRFTQFQLQQPVRKTEVNNGLLNWRAIAASVAAMLAFEQTTKAGDVNDKPKSECTKQRLAIDNSDRTTVTPTEIAKARDLVVGGFQLVPVVAKSDSAIQVRGVVVDSMTNEPLISANVVLQGTQTGTVTDPDGSFVLDVDTDQFNSGALEIRYIGYETRVLPLKDFKHDDTVTVKMSDREFVKGEVIEVVVVCGGVRSRYDQLSEEYGGYLDINKVIARHRERKFEEKLKKKK